MEENSAAARRLGRSFAKRRTSKRSRHTPCAVARGRHTACACYNSGNGYHEPSTLHVRRLRPQSADVLLRGDPGLRPGLQTLPRIGPGRARPGRAGHGLGPGAGGSGRLLPAAADAGADRRRPAEAGGPVRADPPCGRGRPARGADAFGHAAGHLRGLPAGEAGRGPRRWASVSTVPTPTRTMPSAAGRGVSSGPCG